MRIASADTPALRPLLTLKRAVGDDETLFAQRVHFCPLEVKHECLNPPEKENSECFIQMCANIR